MESEQKRLGDFEIVREIGRGGMGVVYEAIQHPLNRKVALKVLPPGATPEQRDIDRFQREARAAALLNHPSIVRIHAQGEEEGTYYYAMALVQGRSLDQIIHDVRGINLEACTPTELARTITADSQAAIALAETPTERMPAPPAERRPTDLSVDYFRTAARLIMEVAEALDYAHSEGVVHRDIKPHNLILTPDGHLVITDFGLARFLSAPSITISGEMMGTPAYMSPEQVRAEQQRINHRTDIYSLGVTLYEMLALEVPFRADTREALLRQILMKDPAPLRRLNPRIPRDLETICAKAIEKDPDRRYQSARLFAHDLHCFLEGLPIAARAIGPLGRLCRRALRRKALTAALVGALLALIVGTYFGSQAYRAHQRELEDQRWALLARGKDAVEAGWFTNAREQFLKAAKMKYDHSVHLCMWLLRTGFHGYALSTLRGHTEGVVCVALSPDGKTLASGGNDNTVKLWDVAAGRELHTFTGHTEAVLSTAFSPDGRTLASGSVDNTVKLWNLATRRELRRLTGHTDSVSSVAFSPVGKTLVSGSHDESIKLWDIATGKELLTLAGHTRRVCSVAFSPDGNTLASGSRDGTIRLWDVTTGRELRTLTGPSHPDILTDWVWSVAFSPSGSTLASGGSPYDNNIKLWDVVTGREFRTVAGHSFETCSVAFSSDGQTLASGGGDNAVKLWDVATGRELRTLKGHTDDVYSVAFSPDGNTLASGDCGGDIKLWDVATARELRRLTGHTNWASSVAFSLDGNTLASGDCGGNIKLWDVITGRELPALSHAAQVAFIAFGADGTAVTLGSDNDTIKVWDAATGRGFLSLAGESRWACCGAFSLDGKTLALGRYKTIKLWDVLTRRELGTLVGHDDRVCCVAFSPDGNTLASGSLDKTIRLWDVASGREVRTLSGHTRDVQAVAFSPDGSILASGSSDQTIRLWDVSTGEELHRLNCRKVATLLFNPDGMSLVSGSWGGTLDTEDVATVGSTATFWDVATGRKIITLTIGMGGISFPCLAFAPDGRRLACCAAKDVLVYDLHAYDEEIERWLREAGIDVDLSSQ